LNDNAYIYERNYKKRAANDNPRSGGGRSEVRQYGVMLMSSSSHHPQRSGVAKPKTLR